jgi:hypothetical protein
MFVTVISFFISYCMNKVLRFEEVIKGFTPRHKRQQWVQSWWSLGRHLNGHSSVTLALRATGAPTKLLTSPSSRLVGQGWLLAKFSQV